MYTISGTLCICMCVSAVRNVWFCQDIHFCASVCVSVRVCNHVRWFAWWSFLFYGRQALNNKSAENKYESRQRQDRSTRRRDKAGIKKGMWGKEEEESGSRKQGKSGQKSKVCSNLKYHILLWMSFLCLGDHSSKKTKQNLFSLSAAAAAAQCQSAKGLKTGRGKPRCRASMMVCWCCVSSVLRWWLLPLWKTNSCDNTREMEEVEGRQTQKREETPQGDIWCQVSATVACLSACVYHSLVHECVCVHHICICFIVFIYIFPYAQTAFWKTVTVSLLKRICSAWHYALCIMTMCQHELSVGQCCISLIHPHLRQLYSGALL